MYIQKYGGYLKKLLIKKRKSMNAKRRLRKFVFILETKELSFCHKLGFLNPNFFKTKCRRPLIFQTMSSGGSNNVSLKYERFASSGCRDLGIKKLRFVAKTQFLST